MGTMGLCGGILCLTQSDTVSDPHCAHSAQPRLVPLLWGGPALLECRGLRAARLCLGSWIMKFVSSVSFKLHIGNTK